MYFTDEELVAFYKRLENEIELASLSGFDYFFPIQVSDAKKLLNVIAAYDGEFGSCSIK